ncbi:MAG: DUF6931 family protein [Kiloniellales bacterium]
MSDLLTNDSSVSAATVCVGLDLSEEAQALLQPDMNARRLINALAQAALPGDAVAVLARASGPQLAIAWALACLEQRLSISADGSEQACLATVRSWLSSPSERLRRAAMETAEAAGYAAPAHWLAAAVGWSGGSLSEPDLPEVPPPPHLFAVAVTAALRLAVAEEPDGGQQKLSEFLKVGARMSQR